MVGTYNVSCPAILQEVLQAGDRTEWEKEVDVYLCLCSKHASVFAGRIIRHLGKAPDTRMCSVQSCVETDTYYYAVRIAL